MPTTTSRLLELLSLLQTGRAWPGTALAARLEVTPRTVRRDVDRLREMGYRIRAIMGPEGGYRLDAGHELPPLLFDDDQVLALAVALQAATLAGAGIEEAAMRALATVRQVMPSRLRHRLDALAFTAIRSRAGDAMADAVHPDVLVALSTAARAHEVLRLDYAGSSADGDESPKPPRKVEPHHLVTSSGRWYLVAWDIDKDDWRIFRADRITPRAHTGPRFAPRPIPGGDVAEFVAARFKGSEQANRWPCNGKVILDKPAADVLPFSGDGVVTALEPDRCMLQAGAWSWIGLAAFFNRFDAAIEVVDPPELTEAFAQLATRNAATAAKGTQTHERRAR